MSRILLEVKKSDMLTIGETHLHFSNTGLFESDGAWIHPTVTIDTFELIFVRDGKVCIREGDSEYTVRKGELLLLSPYVEHGGTVVSREFVSFYWLHFETDCIESFPFPKHFTPAHSVERTFSELMHFQNANRTLADLTLARMLVEFAANVEYGNKTAHEIHEFIRIHAHKPLSVVDVAEHFGYSPDHLSKLLRREFGTDTKTLIIKHRLDYVESLLLNTGDSIKEIALQSGFDDENKFVKFFKYHVGITPTQFRRRFFHVHLNSK